MAQPLGAKGGGVGCGNLHSQRTFLNMWTIRAGGAHSDDRVQATRGRKVLIVFCLAIVPREVWQLVRPLGLAHGGAVPKGHAEWQPRQEGEELRARTRLRAIAIAFRLAQRKAVRAGACSFLLLEIEHDGCRARVRQCTAQQTHAAAFGCWFQGGCAAAEWDLDQQNE